MPATNWVFVRDHKLDLVYFGCVRVFSESKDERELILDDVEVHTNTRPSEKLYCAKAMYLSRNRYDLTIEIPEQTADNTVSSADRKE